MSVFCRLVNRQNLNRKKQSIMGRKKTFLIPPHLVDCGGDLTKQWYVEYSCRNPNTDQMKRFREYGGFTKLRTARERYDHADRLINEIRGKLASGWTPYDTVKRVSYEDELGMQKYAERWGKMRESVPSLRMYLSAFLQLKQETVIPHSYQTYRSKLRIFNEWAEHKGLDQVHVGCFTQERILEFFRYIVKENDLSVRSVKKYRQILHGFFDYLISRKLIVENPVCGVPRMGRKTDEAARPIPDRERKRLLDFMKRNDPQLWLVCLMEYYCAIRPNELRQLRIGDLDLENGVVRIPCTISKNGKTELVNIPNQLHRLLKSMGLEKYDYTDLLFSSGGTPGPAMLGKNTLRYRFDRIRDKLGLPPEYKLYSFKYTGASALVNAGIDTWELQRHMRHKSMEHRDTEARRDFRCFCVSACLPLP